MQSTNHMAQLEEKLSWKRPTGLCNGPISQHSEKKLKDGESGCGWLYSTKTPNQRKIVRKTQKDDTVLKKTIKRILKPKYKLSGEVVFTFSWPGESNRPSSLPSITPLQQTLKNIDDTKMINV